MQSIYCHCEVKDSSSDRDEFNFKMKKRRLENYSPRHEICSILFPISSLFHRDKGPKRMQPHFINLVAKTLKFKEIGEDFLYLLP